jgi:peptidyl-prolyl cis-trans isomerase C/foldase protein PrsA
VRSAGLTCSLASVLLFGCSTQKTPVPVPAPSEAPVATVDGQAITRQELDRALAEEMSAIGGAAGTPGMLETARNAVLDQLIVRLILLRAAREAKIAVSTEEVDRELMRLRLDYAPERFDEVMSQGGQSLADLKKSTAERLTIQKLFREQVYSRVGVTEEEIGAYYDEHLGDFHQPDEVRAAQIVVRTAEQARSIEHKIRSGKDFGEMARTYSLSPDAKRGGDLGYFPRGQMPRQFDEVIFRLKVNQVSGVVRSEYGFHLFKLVARRPARQKRLPEVRGQIEQKLASDKREQAQAEYVKMLRDKAAIKLLANQ